jgi:hypothetical protein
MQRKGDDPSMKGDVPAGLRGRMTSTRATCRAFRSMRRSNAAGEPQGGADIRADRPLENEPRHQANVENKNGKRKERDHEATDARLRGA